MWSETNTCCRKNKHADKHMLLLTGTRHRRSSAVINAQISASSAKDSVMSLTDDAASPPLLLSISFSFSFSQIGTR